MDWYNCNEKMHAVLDGIVTVSQLNGFIRGSLPQEALINTIFDALSTSLLIQTYFSKIKQYIALVQQRSIYIENYPL